LTPVGRKAGELVFCPLQPRIQQYLEPNSEYSAPSTNLWTWTLNWNEVRSNLVVGSCPITAEDLARIHDRTGVDGVLCVQSDECLAHFGIDYSEHLRYGRRLGLDMRRVPMRDFDVADQRRHLADAVRALGQLLSAGRRVYVHCTAGLGRAPLVVVGHLTLVEMMPESEAFALVKARRPGAVPSPEALSGCRADLVRLHRARIEEEAGRIYRRRLAAGRRGDAESDWLEAEGTVLRSAVDSPL
jgi:predicted protein tyrosine phosphatase